MGAKRGRIREDLHGRRFGQWTVVRPAPRKTRTAWYCRCVCGIASVVQACNLKAGKSTGCRRCCGERIAAGKTTRVGDLTKTLYERIRRNAASRSYVFTVSMAYLWQLFVTQGQRCALTGVELQLTAKRTRERVAHRLCSINTASLDRIDPALGYVEGNVRWVHKVINRMRMDLSDEEFRTWCRRVVTHTVP